MARKLRTLLTRPLPVSNEDSDLRSKLEEEATEEPAHRHEELTDDLLICGGLSTKPGRFYQKNHYVLLTMY